MAASSQSDKSGSTGTHSRQGSQILVIPNNQLVLAQPTNQLAIFHFDPVTTTSASSSSTTTTTANSTPSTITNPLHLPLNQPYLIQEDRLAIVRIGTTSTQNRAPSTSTVGASQPPIEPQPSHSNSLESPYAHNNAVYDHWLEHNNEYANLIERSTLRDGGPLFTCKKCGSGYQSLTKSMIHCLRDHNEQAERAKQAQRVQQAQQEQKFLCNVNRNCNKEFATREELTAHKLHDHLVRLPYHCKYPSDEVCGYGSMYRNQTLYHIKSKHLGVPHRENRLDLHREADQHCLHVDVVAPVQRIRDRLNVVQQNEQNAERQHAEPKNAEPPNVEPPNVEPPNVEPPNVEPPNVELPNAELQHAEPFVQNVEPQAGILQIELLEPIDEINFGQIQQHDVQYELPMALPRAYSLSEYIAANGLIEMYKAQMSNQQ